MQSTQLPARRYFRVQVELGVQSPPPLEEGLGEVIEDSDNNITRDQSTITTTPSSSPSRGGVQDTRASTIKIINTNPMDRTLQKALYIILISLGLALVFNFLFFGKLVGISIFIFVVVLVGTVLVFAHYQQISLKKTWWLVTLIGFFALMLSIRANEFLAFLNVVAVFGLLMLLAHQLIGTPAFIMKLRDYIILAVIVPFRMLGRGLSTVSKLGQVHSNVKHRDVWIRVLKGAIMAVPILIIFGLLFAQADLAFSNFLKGFIDISISERSVQYLVLLFFAFIAGLSFLSYIFFPRPVIPAFAEATAGKPDSTISQPGKSIEILVFLSLISVLFLLFIIFQITYLFGGETNIVNTGFTYAEYARRGFFELLAVAVLSLLVLLASEQYAGSKTKKGVRFLVPSLVLIAEVVIVIVSAFKRLSLYIDAYGQTLLRFYVAGFIMLLLVLFTLLAIKFIQAKQEQFFTFGTLLISAAFLVVVNILNPDGFIVNSNLQQFNQTGKIDVYYIGRLSADSTPQKLAL